MSSPHRIITKTPRRRDCSNDKLNSSFLFSSFSSDVPALSPEQLLRRRNDVFKYYNALSKRNSPVSPASTATSRSSSVERNFLENREKHLEANSVKKLGTKPRVIHTIKSPKLQLPQIRRTTSVPCRINSEIHNMPTVREEPVKETWEEIKMLILKLTQMERVSIPSKEIRELIQSILSLKNNG